jgi:pilus assembly protein CpaF
MTPDPSTSTEHNPLPQLVRAATGLGPDRLLVHDVAGEEAGDVFSAMGRVGGTIFTTRAGTSHEGFHRMCALLTMAHLHGDASARASYVAGSLELIVTVAKFPDGQTRITQISEPCLSPAGVPQVVDLFTMDLSTRNWTHTGAHPTFAGELRRRGLVVDLGEAPASDRTQMAPGGMR